MQTSPTNPPSAGLVRNLRPKPAPATKPSGAKSAAREYPIAAPTDRQIYLREWSREYYRRKIMADPEKHAERIQAMREYNRSHKKLPASPSAREIKREIKAMLAIEY